MKEFNDTTLHFEMSDVIRDVVVKVVVRTGLGFRLRYQLGRILLVLGIRMIGARPEVKIDINTIEN